MPSGDACTPPPPTPPRPHPDPQTYGRGVAHRHSSHRRFHARISCTGARHTEHTLDAAGRVSTQPSPRNTRTRAHTHACEASALTRTAHQGTGTPAAPPTCAWCRGYGPLPPSIHRPGEGCTYTRIRVHVYTCTRICAYAYASWTHRENVYTCPCARVNTVSGPFLGKGAQVSQRLSLRVYNMRQCLQLAGRVCL